MNRRRSLVATILFCAVWLLYPSPARAQFGSVPFSDPATGESYHVEVAGGIWNPTPELVISSEALQIAGSQIDAVNDLGIQKKSFRELRIVLRPTRKHKFRINYLPMTYTVPERRITREFVFNGIRYLVGIPVATTFEWKAWDFGYEYDFLYHDRWFAGFILEAKYTDVRVELQSSVLGTEFAHARAPIPTVGGIVRGYVMPNISITGELTGLNIPDTINEDYRAHYVDFNLYGTVNFTDHLGAQLGYRTIDVGYKVKLDTGDFRLNGLYVGGVLRN